MITEKKPNFISLVVSQFKDTTVVGLFLSVIIGLIIGAIEDGRDAKISAFIEPFFALALLIINALMSIFFELRKSRVGKHGQLNQKRNVIIAKNGQKVKIPIEQLSEGDEILLVKGDRSPADIQITKVLSNSLTYESQSKDQLSIELSNNPNGTILQGASIIKGALYGTVQKIHPIDTILQQTKPTGNPFSSQIDSFSNISSMAFLICLLVIFLFNQSPTSNSRFKSFLMALRVPIALLIAGYPEHLSLYSKITPIVAEKMFQSNAILNDNSAVDTLGRMTVLCGNLSSAYTSNVAISKQFTTISDDIVDVFTVTGKDYCPQGEIQQCKTSVDPKQHKTFEMIASAAMLASHITIGLHTTNNGTQQLIAKGSDIINASLQTFAVKLVPYMIPSTESNQASIPVDQQLSILKSVRKALNAKYPVKVIEDFSRKNKCTVIQCGDYKMTIGQYSKVFSSCKSYLDDTNGNIVPISPHVRAKLDYKYQMWSHDYRVLGLSYESQEGNQVWISGIAIYNPLHDDAMSAVEELKGSGVRVLLVSGESLNTVSGYAHKMRLCSDEPIKSVSRQQWIQFNDQQKNDAAREVDLYVEFTEDEKVELIKILHEQKEVVGMISGTVSDIMAMHLVDIGISTIGSCEAIRGVSSVILNNDSDSALSQAILYARSGFNTTISNIRFTMSSSISMVVVCLITSVLRMPVLLSSTSILMISILTFAYTSMISMNINNCSQARISHDKFKYKSANSLSFATNLRIIISGISGAVASILGACFIFLIDSPFIKYRLRFSDLINASSHSSPLLEDKAAPTMATLVILFVYILNAYDALSDNRVFSLRRHFKMNCYLFLSILSFAIITQYDVFRGIFGYSGLSIRRWIIGFGISLIHAFINFMLKLIFH